ncbi:cell division protein ZapD [Anaerobiospirillum thomasii]|uniref:Protein of uncharacterized function (DUF1342) n=1 Tax=Anaerobiospirillum thomasii TaxID=179995 RepID=A0A2X0VJJ6_9GAMM|nr:cell division protein ZapD [Anaerobiospirillum thomasii]SPT69658.1 Protein of uncharacterised function (DUF1342) [Anaerobiospirillum thomasii]
MFVYDFPLSPKARTYLKFEAIFNRIEQCRQINSEAELFSLIRGVVDYMDLIDGSGALKIEIVKDLERLHHNLKIWADDPEVDSDLVQELLAQLNEAHLALDKFTRQRTVLQDDPILETIKPRFLTPCGVNCFDTPLFTFWSSLPKEEQINTITKWLHELDSIRIPVATILYMWRLCAEYQVKLAKNGFMQETTSSCDLIEIRYPRSVRGYPMVSGFQSSVNVRFLPYEKGATVGDIEFELAYIKGTSM